MPRGSSGSGVSLSKLKRQLKAIARTFFGIVLLRATLFPIIANVQQEGMFNNCTRHTDGMESRKMKSALYCEDTESDWHKLNQNERPRRDEIERMIQAAS